MAQINGLEYRLVPVFPIFHYALKVLSQSCNPYCLYSKYPSISVFKSLQIYSCDQVEFDMHREC